ncbi:S-antigen protein-like [Salvelinus sp. IW2-2015]|uniref:S-antigen protein-like n=1 Tax=Salvelinus sp. IW2-2015 TaxID=2691554 RepID=UPI0038D484A6
MTRAARHDYTRHDLEEGNSLTQGDNKQGRRAAGFRGSKIPRPERGNTWSPGSKGTKRKRPGYYTFRRRHGERKEEKKNREKKAKQQGQPSHITTGHENNPKENGQSAGLRKEGKGTTAAASPARKDQAQRRENMRNAQREETKTEKNKRGPSRKKKRKDNNAKKQARTTKGADQDNGRNTRHRATIRGAAKRTHKEKEHTGSPRKRRIDSRKAEGQQTNEETAGAGDQAQTRREERWERVRGPQSTTRGPDEAHRRNQPIQPRVKRSHRKRKSAEGDADKSERRPATSAKEKPDGDIQDARPRQQGGPPTRDHHKQETEGPGNTGRTETG